MIGLRWTPAPLLCLLALAGCLGEDGAGEGSTTVAGDTARVYLSLPRQGVSAPAARAVEAGARLALADARGRAAGLRIELVPLSATEAAEPGEEQAPWSPGPVSENADRAADDPKAIAYIGELAYGASAVSAPLTNDAHLLQVSPLDGLTSITRTPPGRPRSAPERLQPTGERNFARLVPSDLLEVEVLLELIRSRGAERLAIVFDQDVYAREFAAQVLARARRDGPEPVASEEYRGDVEEIPDIARALAKARPDAVVYAGIAGPGSGRLLAAIDDQMPGVPLYTAAGLRARDASAPIPSAPVSVELLDPVPPAGALPASARRLLRADRARGRLRRRAARGGLRLRVHAARARRDREGRARPGGGPHRRTRYARAALPARGLQDARHGGRRRGSIRALRAAGRPLRVRSRAGVKRRLSPG